ncbi:MAG: polysaccharide pyruvyl transferase family protein, partial [Clostridia bacterium]|nr:polysaccharide pyruvyl transferase family protein [Clostridia bacterium]
EAKATAERLSTDLLSLLSDPAERERVAAEGSTLVRSSFSAERMCRETLALYRRLSPSPSPKKGKRILLGGYFGCGNFGDDAILLGLLRLLQDADPSLTVRALTKDPRRDARRFGIPCHGRKNPLSILSALCRSDLFLCGGGSLLQNRTGSLSLLYYLTLLRLAKALGRKTVLFAAGIGPILGEDAWRKTLRVLSHIDRVSLRDDASLSCLRRAGLPEPLLFRGADTALWMPLPDSSRGEMLLNTAGLPPKGEYLAVLLRKAHNPTLLPRITQAIAALCRSAGLTPLWIPLDAKADLPCSARAAAECGGALLRPCEPGDVAALLSVCRVGVTLRLHGAILGAAVGTPMLSVLGDPLDQKLSAFASCMKLPCLCDPDALPQAVKALLKHGFGEEQWLSLAAERKKAWKDLANALEMLYNKDGQSDCHFQERG